MPGLARANRGPRGLLPLSVPHHWKGPTMKTYETTTKLSVEAMRRLLATCWCRRTSASCAECRRYEAAIREVEPTFDWQHNNSLRWR